MFPMRGNYLQLICIVATVLRCHSVFDWYNLRARTHVLTNLSMLDSIAHSRCTLHTKYHPTGISMKTENELKEKKEDSAKHRRRANTHKHALTIAHIEPIMTIGSMWGPKREFNENIVMCVSAGSGGVSECVCTVHTHRMKQKTLETNGRGAERRIPVVTE